MEDQPTKTCIRCEKVLAATENNFYKQKGCRYGLAPKCITCTLEYAQTQRQKPGYFEKQQEYHKGWRSRQPKKNIPLLDLVGKQFGEYVVLSKAESNENNLHRWLCRCSCGTEKVVYGNTLLGGTQRCRNCSNAFGRPNKRVKIIVENGIEMKTCTGCKNLLPVSQFKTRKTTRLPAGFQYLSHCKVCSRNKSRKAMLKKCYGITPEDFEAMKEQQKGLCAICQTDTPGGAGDWHVDHCHQTGRVRGLLCRACNLSLGGYEFIKQFDPELYLKGDVYGLPL